MMWVFSVLLSICAASGCQKDEQDTGYAELPLIGTKWKLVGFANEKTGEIQLAEPSGNETYTLQFKEGSFIEGVTSTNRAHGKYELFEDTGGKISIVQFGAITEINELYDGNQYIEAMRLVDNYRINAQSLSLYYSTDDYLLFRPQSD